MLKRNKDPLGVLDVEQVGLECFSRSIAKIEWLLLLLVVLYCVSPWVVVNDAPGQTVATAVFAGFVLAFRFIEVGPSVLYRKLALETWVMLGFITWSLRYTGGLASPLLSLYFLVIICSGIMLGRWMTFLQVAAIGAIFLVFAVGAGAADGPAGAAAALLAFTPFLLVAFVTSLLAADVNDGRRVLKALSETDELTGLLNTRSFRPMWRKATEVAEKYSQPLSVMMIDADNLKRVNATHGRKAGDQLIAGIARTMEECLRTSDVLCRLGGDEFVALLPQLPAERATETAERLRSAIENSAVEARGKRLSTTVSIGVASYPDEVIVVDELLDRAEEALLASKKSGRNAVMNWSRACLREGRPVRPGPCLALPEVDVV